MAKTLVLIRHGKAAPRETWHEDDVLRPLTEGGKRALEAHLPHMLALLDKETRANACIWTSPAVRTVQTAQVVAGILGASAPQEQEFLLTEDADAFLRAFEQCDASCVIAVGHNPFVDDMAARLAGARLPFFTGAAAALRVADGASESSRPAARLLWFVQGPKASRFANLVAFEEVLRSGAEAVDARLRAFLENPSDPETMHKFRVSIRTLRSLAAFVAPWQKASQNKKLQLRLRTVVRWTSRLRELDVLCGQAAELVPANEELCAAIAQARDEERARVQKRLASKRCANLLSGAYDLIRDTAWKGSVKRGGLSRKAIRARFERLLGCLEDAMAALDAADAEATHDVRKDAKRVRYSAENFGAFLDEGAVTVAKRMVKMQDGLGAVCDARVNLAIIDGFPRKKLSEQANAALDALRAQNAAFLEQALSAGEEVAAEADDGSRAVQER